MRRPSRWCRDYSGASLSTPSQPSSSTKLEGLFSKITTYRRSLDAQVTDDGRHHARSPDNNAGTGISRERAESIAAGLLLAYRRRSRRGTTTDSDSSGLITQAHSFAQRHSSAGLPTDALEAVDKRTTRANQLKSIKRQHRVSQPHVLS